MNLIRIASAVLVGLLSALCLQGADSPAFSAAAIHRLAPDDTRFFVHLPSDGHFSATGCVARLLIMIAYDIQESQIAGDDGWIATDKWDIVANAPGPHSTEDTRRMLQALLRDALLTPGSLGDTRAFVLCAHASEGRPETP